MKRLKIGDIVHYKDESPWLKFVVIGTLYKYSNNSVRYKVFYFDTTQNKISYTFLRRANITTVLKEEIPENVAKIRDILLLFDKLRHDYDKNYHKKLEITSSEMCQIFKIKNKNIKQNIIHVMKEMDGKYGGYEKKYYYV